LRDHQEKWASTLSERCEGYSVCELVETDDFSGATEPEPSPRAAADYVNIVRALRELETLFPEAEVFISDSSSINDEARPGAIDLESLREAMLREWSADGTFEGVRPEAEGAELQDLDAVEIQRVLREVAPLLEQAKNDFAIWKRAQDREELD
jgi:hypothetical protein